MLFHRPPAFVEGARQLVGAELVEMQSSADRVSVPYLMNIGLDGEAPRPARPMPGGCHPAQGKAARHGLETARLRWQVRVVGDGRTEDAMTMQPGWVPGGVDTGKANIVRVYDKPWAPSAMLSAVTAIEPSQPAPARDPHRPARLLRAEHDALLPILHRTPDRAFDYPTACPGWSVRDVLAHCAAALSRVATGNLHAFTPALNEIDVAERRRWPLTDVLSEFTAGYLDAGKTITDAGGELDVIALGEWLHGGDIRDALGEPLAYASDGFDDACALLTDWTRRRATPLVKAHMPGSTLTLGVAKQNRAPATLHTTRPALMRLFAGRPAEISDYQLTGATAAELVVF